MKNNCPTCQHYNSDKCAVNPSYWERYTLLDRRLTKIELALIETEFPPCSDWEQTKALRPITAEITLTFKQWQSLTRAWVDRRLPIETLKGVQEQLPKEDVLKFPVDFSNIAAIGLRMDIYSGINLSRKKF